MSWIDDLLVAFEAAATQDPPLPWQDVWRVILEYIPTGAVADTYGDTVTGVQNGSNTVFTTGSNYNAGTLAVYLNGIRQRKTHDYTESAANQFTFIVAPVALDTISVDYTETI